VVIGPLIVILCMVGSQRLWLLLRTLTEGLKLYWGMLLRLKDGSVWYWGIHCWCKAKRWDRRYEVSGMYNVGRGIVGRYWSSEEPCDGRRNVYRVDDIWSGVVGGYRFRSDIPLVPSRAFTCTPPLETKVAELMLTAAPAQSVQCSMRGAVIRT